MNTKEQFLIVLQREISKHEWAKDPERLAKMMEAARQTLNGRKTCIIDSESWKIAWKIAWKEIGMKGNPTFKGLCALPESAAA